jgi:hypothetical protein
MTFSLKENLVLQGHKKRQEKKKKIISDGFSPNSN